MHSQVQPQHEVQFSVQSKSFVSLHLPHYFYYFVRINCFSTVEIRWLKCEKCVLSILFSQPKKKTRSWKRSLYTLDSDIKEINCAIALLKCHFANLFYIVQHCYSMWSVLCTLCVTSGWKCVDTIKSFKTKHPPPHPLVLPTSYLREQNQYHNCIIIKVFAPF